MQSINDESLINPSINTNFFTNAIIGKYWSSTTLPNFTARAWYLDTKFGVTTYSNKTNKLRVYLVRGNGILTNNIDEITESAQLEIYPNPCSTNLKLKGVSMGSIINIFSIAGELIYTNNYSGSIDLTGLSKGLYILQVKNRSVKFSVL
jgi:hypothetical protein